MIFSKIRAYDTDIMGSKNKTKQPALMIRNLTFGKHLAQLRKEKGYTQVELAKKMDIVQVLISDYELDKLRPYHKMIIRFAEALEISTDELLGVKPFKSSGHKVSRKIMKMMDKVEKLPPAQQKSLLQTIEMFLKGAESEK